MPLWNPPITWQVDQLVTESDLNQQVRDNLLYLKERADTPYVSTLIDESNDPSTTSNLWVDIDATRLSLSLMTRGNPLLVGFFGIFSTSAGVEVLGGVDVSVDGVRYAGGDGLAPIGVKAGLASVQYQPLGFVLMIPNLPAAVHVLRLQWRVVSNSPLVLRWGGMGGQAFHPNFWAWEI